ncbi:FeoB-associated Cys-rich membrane protein [Barnesiella intestinihominis]|uniref:FeoB-associated Cys-rich membrane protein n=1 Tax=Barnesiella intestinihominis TaxID=487174 RepID=UPI000B001B94
MNSTIQSLIVGVILLIVVFYVIHKIFKMVRNRKEPTSACCGCNKPCKVEKIDKKR